jgi:nucleoid-associated protein YgaU
MRSKQQLSRVATETTRAAPISGRWKTLAGLAIVTIAGAALALVFTRGAQDVAPAPLATGALQPAERQHSRQAGRIVPLMIDGAEDHAGDAAGPSAQRRVGVLPTIRRDPWGTSSGAPEREAPASSSDPSPPQMAPSFPHALSLLGIPALNQADSSPAHNSDAPIVLRNEPMLHTIVDGDTLAALADRYLHDGQRAEEIFAHNRNVLASPDLLPIGAVLKIPAAP